MPEPSDSLQIRLSVALLEVITLAAGAVAADQDARNPLCRNLASMFDAPAAGHAHIDVPAQHAELFLWRRASVATGIIATIQVPEPRLAAAPETARWFASAARRTMHQWIDLPFLAELPLTVDLGRLCFLVLGRARPFDGDDERLLALAGRHLAALEAVRWHVESLQPAEHRHTAGHGAGLGASPSIHLTHREVEVLLLLREGLLARSIANRLTLSERTVHKHLASIYTKLGVHDRLLAVRRAEALGLVEIKTPDPDERQLA